YAPATITRRVTGVGDRLRRFQVPVDPRGTAAATAAVHAYERRLAEADKRLGRGKARQVTPADVLVMAQACPDTPEGLRDRAAPWVPHRRLQRRQQGQQLGSPRDRPARPLG